MGRMQFEIGKQYVCANGKVVVVKVPHGEGFIGSEILGHSSLEQQSFVYEPDGRPRGNDYAEWTIIKEFRFDGPRETKPSLPFGDGYLTRSGLPAGVTGARNHGRVVDGWVDFPDGRTKVAWHHDGRIHPDKNSDLDLMERHVPGPREINDPEYDVSRLGPNGSARREAKIEVDTDLRYDHPEIGARPPHDNVTDRLDRIERELSFMSTNSDRRDSSVTEVFRQLASIRARARNEENEGLERDKVLDRLTCETDSIRARLAKMDEEAALNLTATDTRLDRLSGIINEQDKRLDTAFQCIDAINNRLDKLETLPGLATLNRAVVDINDRLDRIALEIATKANAEGVKGELADRATIGDIRQVHSRLNRISSRLGILLTTDEIIAAGPTPIESKRLYAGGWLNIYVDDAGKLSVGVLQEDRATCDKRDTTGPRVRRIACIPLTRIREGDGL